MAKIGVKEIVLCTGHMSSKIRDYINKERNDKDSAFKGLDIRFLDEGNNKLGTGGALKNARHLLKERFFLLNGDTLFLSNLVEITRCHISHSSDVTIGLTEVHDSKRYGTVTLENRRIRFSRILAFHEKEDEKAVSSGPQIVNAGLYLIETRFIDWLALPNKFSLEIDFLPGIIQKYRIYGFLDRGSYFIDMGTPDGYRKLQQDVATNKIVIGPNKTNY